MLSNQLATGPQKILWKTGFWHNICPVEALA